MESSQRDLRRSHTLGLIQLVTQGYSAFILGTIGVGAFALALPELSGKPVAGRVSQLQDLTRARHHDPKLWLEVDVAFLIQRPDEASPQLRRTLPDVAPERTVECGFHYIFQRARSEKRPVLPPDKENVEGVAGVVIETDECQTQLRLIAADRRNVAVVDFAEVAFEVSLDLAGQRQILRNVRPFQVEPKARGPRLDVDLGVLGRTGVEGRVGSGIQPYARKRKVVAIGIAAVMDECRFDKTVRCQR